ncbi:MAG: selenium-dependent xanthine dehydrogenase [Myxococcota bacterium]
MEFKFTLNGQEKSLQVDDRSTLLEAIREECGVTSVKDGCAPQGQCGCCTALVDGWAVTTCAVPCSKQQGAKVTTLEGLPEADRRLLADCFVAKAGLQCGFCIPGIVMRAYSILEKNPNPTDAEIAKKLDVHLCRCTGYVKIIEAIQLAAAVKRGEALPPRDESGRVGTSLDRVDGKARALGENPYVADMKVEGMLHGAVRFSDHARAQVIKIDVTKALAAPGVRAVATYKDVPGKRCYGILYDDWPGFIAEGEETHYVGDVLAVVAADTPRQARDAAALVEVEYEVKVPVTDPEEAIKPGAPKISPKPNNVLSKSVITRGNAEDALKDSKYVVEGTWQTQRIEHMFLEPESALAVPEATGDITLYSQGQGIFDDQRQCASFLGVEQDKIRVVLVPNGGAFGGKEDMSVQAHACLLARMTGKPVRVTLTRDDSIRMHPKRHPIRLHYRVGADENGKLTAVWARMLGDSGAYASVGGKVLERAAGHACGAYDVPNVDVEAIAAYTNNLPCGAMRGFGANQAAFAMEGCMDLLAEKLGLDAWEIRWRNALQVGSVFCTGQVLEKSVGLKKTLEAVKPHYEKAKAEGKAVGIGCGIKNSGIGNGVPEWGRCRLVVEKDATVSLYNGYTEMGQGLLTILIQCACEVTGLPASVFRAKVDTIYPLGSGQTTGSRATLFGGNAVIMAAKQLKADLDGGATLKDLSGKVYAGDFLCNDTTPLGAKVDKVKTHTAFGFATQVVILDAKGKVERVIAAHDVGRAINPALCQGQIEGSVHMGLGYALSEELATDEDGFPVTTRIRDIGVLRAKHMPKVDVIIVEDHEPEGPFGAKGVGEIGLVPTAGAVAGALAKFEGKRRYKLPMRDSPAAAGIVKG